MISKLDDDVVVGTHAMLLRNKLGTCPQPDRAQHSATWGWQWVEEGVHTACSDIWCLAFSVLVWKILMKFVTFSGVILHPYVGFSMHRAKRTQIELRCEGEERRRYQRCSFVYHFCKELWDVMRLYDMIWYDMIWCNIYTYQYGCNLTSIMWCNLSTTKINRSCYIFSTSKGSLGFHF